MINTHFNEIQKDLLDPRNQTTKAKQNITVGLLAGKLAFGGAAAITGTFALASLVSCVSSPILGAIGVVFWGAPSLIALDAYTITANIEDILSSVSNRIYNASLASIFVDSLFKNTNIARPLLTQISIEQLNSSRY
jgi:hypothetical protein